MEMVSVNNKSPKQAFDARLAGSHKDSRGVHVAQETYFTYKVQKPLPVQKGEAFFVCSGLCSGYMYHCFISTLTVLLPILTIATEPDRREVLSDATPVVAMTESSCTPFTP